MEKESFREKIKKEISSQLMKVETKNKEQMIEKCDLGLRLLKFFEYEKDSEFEKWFDNFCRAKEKRENEREER